MTCRNFLLQKENYCKAQCFVKCSMFVVTKGIPYITFSAEQISHILNSVHKFIAIQALLLLTFVLCLHN